MSERLTLVLLIMALKAKFAAHRLHLQWRAFRSRTFMNDKTPLDIFHPEPILSLMLKYIEYLRLEGKTQDTARALRSGLRRLTKVHTLTVVAFIEESGGSSVVAGTRPGFNRLVHLLETGRANAILCPRIETLSRNVLELAKLRQLFESGKLVEIQTMGGATTKELVAFTLPMRD